MAHGTCRASAGNDAAVFHQSSRAYAMSAPLRKPPPCSLSLPVICLSYHTPIQLNNTNIAVYIFTCRSHLISR